MEIIKLLRRAFEPKSVAVVCSRRAGIAEEVVRNILESGFRGDIYVIGGEGIAGVKTCRAVDRLPEGLDIALVATPAEEVLEVLERLGRKGVGVVVILTRGFSETCRSSGRVLERAITTVVRKYGVRVIGPGSQGISNPSVGFCASWPAPCSPGPLAIVSRSGAVAALLARWAEAEGMGVSKLVTLGNKVDLDESDMLEYLREDEGTKSIMLYLEAINNGRRFINVASKVVLTKPVVALKSGKSRSGAFAVASRLGMPAGHYRFYIEAFRKSGVIPAYSLEELYDIGKGVALLPRVSGSGVQVVTTSIGGGVIAADALELNGLNVIKPSPEVKEDLRKLLGEHALVSNPLNLPRDVEPEKAVNALEKVLGDPRVDMVALVIVPRLTNIARDLHEVVRGAGKPVAVAVLGGGAEDLRVFHRFGIPAYPTPERLARALASLTWYSQYLLRVGEEGLD